MTMGNGCVFLPEAKPIRKALGKEEGQGVFNRLFKKEIPHKLPH
jgi:hypothetical protein